MVSLTFPPPGAEVATVVVVLVVAGDPVEELGPEGAVVVGAVPAAATVMAAFPEEK